MPEQFVVGSEGGTIGTAVRKPRGFKFISAHDDFAPLDGRVFSRARLLVKEVAKHAQKNRRPSVHASKRETELW